MTKKRNVPSKKLIIVSDSVRTVMIPEGIIPVLTLHDEGEPEEWMEVLATAINLINCGSPAVRIWSKRFQWFVKENPDHANQFVEKIHVLATILSGGAANVNVKEGFGRLGVLIVEKWRQKQL